MKHFALFDGEGETSLLLSEYRRPIAFEVGAEDAEKGLRQAFAEIEIASAQGEWVAVAADYALAPFFDPAMASTVSDGARLRGWVFGQAQTLDAGAAEDFLRDRLASLQASERIAGIAEVGPRLTASEHAACVRRIHRWITDGDCYQVNLTFPVDFSYYGHPLALYAALRARQPVRNGGCLLVPGGALLSFSPELFFARSAAQVTTRPMKGTAPRGETPASDQERCTALLASEKERAENVMIVDLLRNDLGRLAFPGKVTVESLCVAEAYPSVWQMVSTVSAQLPEMPLFDLFRALFPCGSITGAPKIRAMQRIAELEKAPRGLYTGTLGWVAPGGDCRFNVAIRTPELDANGHGRMGLGSGIVIDTNPASEYAECLLKARFLTGLDPGFELIETLRLDQGEYPLLALHKQRLVRSAKALGFSCDLPAVSALLAAQKQGRKTGVYRVRLTLNHAGKIRVSVTPFEESAAERILVLADEPLDEHAYLLRHKTTARHGYDQALSRIAGQRAVFDVLFFNTRGEVCEGARSNVFVERDGRLLTPPLSSGLLPGVMRQHLLDSGRAVAQVLTRDDLSGTARIWMGNALRGLVPVRLAGGG